MGTFRQRNHTRLESLSIPLPTRPTSIRLLRDLHEATYYDVSRMAHSGTTKHMLDCKIEPACHLCLDLDTPCDDLHQVQVDEPNSTCLQAHSCLFPQSFALHEVGKTVMMLPYRKRGKNMVRHSAVSVLRTAAVRALTSYSACTYRICSAW